MKSRAERSGSSKPSRGRAARAVLHLCAASLPLLAACGPQVGAEQKPGVQDPGIQIQSPGTLEKPAPAQRSGLFVPALVCKGYVAVDGNRWVQNPIVDKNQIDKNQNDLRNYTPMTVSHHYDVLDINPSMPQEGLTYYDQSGHPLLKGKKPTCASMLLKIATINTDFPNMDDPTKPNAMAFHTFGDAYADVNTNPLWEVPKNPGHVYSVTFGKDSLTSDHLANVEGTF